MTKIDLVTLNRQEEDSIRAGASIVNVSDRSCGCACVNDYMDENGQWAGDHTYENTWANYNAPGQDGWGAWSPEMWHLRREPTPLS